MNLKADCNPNRLPDATRNHHCSVLKLLYFIHRGNGHGRLFEVQKTGFERMLIGEMLATLKTMLFLQIAPDLKKQTHLSN